MVFLISFLFFVLGISASEHQCVTDQQQEEEAIKCISELGSKLKKPKGMCLKDSQRYTMAVYAKALEKVAFLVHKNFVMRMSGKEKDRFSTLHSRILYAPAPGSEGIPYAAAIWILSDGLLPMLENLYPNLMRKRAHVADPFKVYLRQKIEEQYGENNLKKIIVMPCATPNFHGDDTIFFPAPAEAMYKRISSVMGHELAHALNEYGKSGGDIREALYFGGLLGLTAALSIGIADKIKISPIITISVMCSLFGYLSAVEATRYGNHFKEYRADVVGISLVPSAQKDGFVIYGTEMLFHRYKNDFDYCDEKGKLLSARENLKLFAKDKIIIGRNTHPSEKRRLRNGIYHIIREMPRYEALKKIDDLEVAGVAAANNCLNQLLRYEDVSENLYPRVHQAVKRDLGNVFDDIRTSVNERAG